MIYSINYIHDIIDLFRKIKHPIPKTPLKMSDTVRNTILASTKSVACDLKIRRYFAGVFAFSRQKISRKKLEYLFDQLGKQTEARIVEGDDDLDRLNLEEEKYIADIASLVKITKRDSPKKEVPPIKLAKNERLVLRIPRISPEHAKNKSIDFDALNDNEAHDLIVLKVLKKQPKQIHTGPIVLKIRKDYVEPAKMAPIKNPGPVNAIQIGDPDVTGITKERIAKEMKKKRDRLKYEAIMTRLRSGQGYDPSVDVLDIPQVTEAEIISELANSLRMNAINKD